MRYESLKSKGDWESVLPTPKNLEREEGVKIEVERERNIGVDIKGVIQKAF